MKKTVICVALLATLMCLSGCGIERDRNLTLRTQANSAASIAQADSAARQVESNASMTNYKTLADAAKPDNTVLILVIIGMFGIGGMLVYMLVRTNLTHAQTLQAVILAQLPAQSYRTLPGAPERVRLAAEKRGGYPEWDGERWLIVDAAGRVLARQRMIEG